MRILYSAGLLFYSAIIRLAAFCGNTKAQQWVHGRKNWAEKLAEKLAGKNSDRIWIHCASLGEFEQGRPLIEAIKKNSPQTVIILSFFSPSGFEVRKNYSLADVVCYLPVDSGSNARNFINTVNPTNVIFIKYEFWFHYFHQLHKNKIPLYLASAIFRPGQIFFRSYGGFFRNALKNVSHFFVQDENSKQLLSSIGFTNATVAGDTRFDRVAEVVSSKNEIGLLEKFKNSRKLIIAGSTWKEDEEVLLDALKKIDLTDIAVVFAPHEVNEGRTGSIRSAIKNSFPDADICSYSSGLCNGGEKFFILDTIGLLSSAYAYGTIAWIGGGFGKGIHNILEAAAFGNPVVFGPHYEKFKEARDLIRLHGAWTVTHEDAHIIIERLLNDTAACTESSRISAEYVQANLGATKKILHLTRIVPEKFQKI